MSEVKCTRPLESCGERELDRAGELFVRTGRPEGLPPGDRDTIRHSDLRHLAEHQRWHGDDNEEGREYFHAHDSSFRLIPPQFRIPDP